MIFFDISLLKISYCDTRQYPSKTKGFILYCFWKHYLFILGKCLKFCSLVIILHISGSVLYFQSVLSLLRLHFHSTEYSDVFLICKVFLKLKIYKYTMNRKITWNTRCTSTRAKKRTLGQLGEEEAAIPTHDEECGE